MLRIEAFLIVRRNQTRDVLGVAALSDRMGTDRAAEGLAGMDAYDADPQGSGDGVASQVARQLAEPRPKDARTPRERVRDERSPPAPLLRSGR